MPTPVILTVDDEPQVLNAIERDLRSHYRNTYRIVKAGSGAEALDATRRLQERGTPVALFLADQRMPAMTGTQFLEQAKTVYPDARKVLLTAYADTEAAISSINTIGLDYYLMKPWDPPEQRLYPVLDDLLSSWSATADLPYDGIRVAGTLWSATSHATKDFLARNRIPYQWLDIERDERARAMVEHASGAHPRLPIVFFPDGTVLAGPTNLQLADKVGLQTQATKPLYDLVIIGGGPAGLGAAVNAVSEGLRTAMVEREATGGQAGTSARIENYLGFPNGISGADLAQRATVQARRFGAEVLTAQEAVKVRVEHPFKIVTLSGGAELTCKALIVATGVNVRQLDVPGATGLAGAGLYYGAAATEAAYYRGQHVFVVGGANSAGQGAVFLARYAAQVTMLVRGDDLEKGMSQYLVDQIRATPNIDVVLNADVTALHGETKLDGLTYRRMDTNQEVRTPAAAVFVFIGATPYTEFIAGVVERNAGGFILTGADLVRDGKRPAGWTLQRDPYALETSVPGIFAAGDVRQGVVRRVASAVSEGGIAVSTVHQYLATV